MAGLATLFTPSTFSICLVQTGNEVYVPIGQQMVLYQCLTIVEEGTLILDGETAIL